MKTILDSLLRPVLAAIMAVVVANCSTDCKPASGPGDAYTAEVAACATTSKSLYESCGCRKATDIKWGVCDKWPDQGKCSVDCEQFK